MRAASISTDTGSRHTFMPARCWSRERAGLRLVPAGHGPAQHLRRVLRGLSGNRLAAFQRISRLAAAMRARHVLRAGPRTRDVSPGSRSRTRCLGGWWLRGAGPAYLPGNFMSMHASGQATCGAPMCRGKGTTATGRPAWCLPCQTAGTNQRAWLISRFHCPRGAVFRRREAADKGVAGRWAGSSICRLR